MMTLQRASDCEALMCSLVYAWKADEQTTVELPVMWDALTLMCTSLLWKFDYGETTMLLGMVLHNRVLLRYWSCPPGIFRLISMEK